MAMQQKDGTSEIVAQNGFETAADLFRETGLKPWAIERHKDILAANHVTFCIHSVKKTEPVIDGKQAPYWELRVEYSDETGKVYYKIVSLPQSEFVRNDVCEAIQAQLARVPVSHAWELEVEDISGERIHYNIVSARDVCSHIK